MKCFLSEERRRALMQYLLGSLNVSAERAIQLAFLPDDQFAVDASMSWHARDAIKMAELIAIIGESDPLRLFECSVFLSVDLVVMGAYKDEARERGILGAFANWVEAGAHMVLS
jgi:hypothetical protein